MSPSDIALVLGALVSAWALGFVGGYTLTKFKDALSQTI